MKRIAYTLILTILTLRLYTITEHNKLLQQMERLDRINRIQHYHRYLMQETARLR